MEALFRYWITLVGKYDQLMKLQELKMLMMLVFNDEEREEITPGHHPCTEMYEALSQDSDIEINQKQKNRVDASSFFAMTGISSYSDVRKIL